MIPEIALVGLAILCFGTLYLYIAGLDRIVRLP